MGKDVWVIRTTRTDGERHIPDLRLGHGIGIKGTVNNEIGLCKPRNTGGNNYYHRRIKLAMGERKNMPKRIQRKRSKGWRMPENTVYVGRPSKWGNPFTGPHAVEWYKKYAEQWTVHFREGVIKELRGKDLACWCPLNKPCHADVLLEIMYAEITKKTSVSK